MLQKNALRDAHNLVAPYLASPNRSLLLASGHFQVPRSSRYITDAEPAI
jgi:hypothetical protein